MRRPESTAARCDGETLTYEQLARRSAGLARVLWRRAIRSYTSASS